MEKSRQGVRFAVIGYGAITHEIVRTLDQRGELDSLLGALVRPARLAEAIGDAAGRFAVVDSIDALLDLGPQVVAECAGHGAMREFGTAVSGAALIFYAHRLACLPRSASRLTSSAPRSAGHNS